MNTTFTFLTFEEWTEINPDIKGEKAYACDCGKKNDCKKCNGTGEVSAITLKQKYNEQRKLDEANLENWLKNL